MSDRKKSLWPPTLQSESGRPASFRLGTLKYRTRTFSRMLGPLLNVLLFYFSGRAGNVASLYSMTLLSPTSSVSRFVIALGPF